MSQHIHEDHLAAFAEGELGDHLAALVAEHLDECPRCASRARLLDPLQQAFASAHTVGMPELPPGLVERILQADGVGGIDGADGAEANLFPSTWELWAGSALLGVAALLVVISPPLQSARALLLVAIRLRSAALEFVTDPMVGALLALSVMAAAALAILAARPHGSDARHLAEEIG